MRIILISTGVLPVFPVGYGGLEAVIGDLAVCLDKLGHEVHVVAPTESNIGSFGNVKLIDGGHCSPNAHAWEANAFNKYRPMMDSAEFKDAVWHDHSWTKPAYIAKIQNPNLKVMSTLHGMLCYHKPPPVERPCMAGISKDHASRMSSGLGVPVRFVYNGIDLSKYSFYNGERSDRFLTLSRITTFKGAHTFVDLMRKMQAKGDLVGDDKLVEDQEYVKRVMDACTAYPDVRYWGGVNRERAVEFMQKAKCHVEPYDTKIWAEPFSLTTIETMACGTPVVATASGGLPELIEHGVSGYVVQSEHDLTEYLTSDKLKEIKPEACRKQAEKFSRERMTEGYVELYNQVLSGGGW